GFIAVINVPVDAGQTGGSVVANANEPASFYEHEMLHVYGLPHSFTMAADSSSDHMFSTGSDRVYDDCWDVMSYATCTFRFDQGRHGGQGPELEIAYREKLGWVAANRLSFLNSTSATASQSTVTLATVSEPNQLGFLMAKIALTNPGDYYVVEYHAKTGFD